MEKSSSIISHPWAARISSPGNNRFRIVLSRMWELFPDFCLQSELLIPPLWRRVKGIFSGGATQLASTWTGRSNCELTYRCQNLSPSFIPFISWGQSCLAIRGISGFILCGVTTWWLQRCVPLTQSDLHSDTHTVYCHRPGGADPHPVCSPAASKAVRLCYVSRRSYLLTWWEEGGDSMKRATFLTKGGDFWEERWLPFSRAFNRNSALQYV